MVNKSISYKLLLFSLIICAFESCTNAIIPHYIRKKFNNHTASNYNLNDNLININNGYYQYTIEFYKPKRIDTVLSYSNDGKIEKKTVTFDNNITCINILFLENGFCCESIISGFVPKNNINNNEYNNDFLEYKWGEYKIVNDTIKVKTIYRGSVNAGFDAEEKWFKINGKEDLRLIYIKDLTNDKINNANLNPNFDSIKLLNTSYFPLKKTLINPYNSWLFNKKWFWKNKKEYLEWKRKT